jgi:hypothetical protein
MRRSSLALTAFLSVLALATSVRAQSDERRIEVGGHFVALSTNLPMFSDPQRNYVRPGDESPKGVGGRVGYRVTNHFSIEAEANAFPGNDLTYQLLAGARVGVSGQKFGVYGKVRPGFVHFLRVADFPPDCYDGTRDCAIVGRNRFAVDIGGSFEYYPTKRAILRLDVGDTLLLLPDRGTIGTVPVPGGSVFGPVTIRGTTAHNFQISVGFGFRF